MAKRGKKITKALRGAGWTLVRRTKHEVWRCGCGKHQVVLPTTYGEGRSLANNMAMFKRSRVGDCEVRFNG